MSKDEIEKKSIIQNNSKEKIEIKKIRIKFEKKRGWIILYWMVKLKNKSIPQKN